MSAVALAGLARPRSSADRRRSLLVAAACAGTVTVVLVGLRILRFVGDDGTTTLGSEVRYASYIQEQGLRPGMLFGVLLCCIPPLVLLVQALRVGSAARERRLIAIRLAGASHRQLRSLALIEGARAGVAGGVAGTIGYLLLGLATLQLSDVNLRIVPTADLLDLLVVPVVVLGIAVLAGFSAMLSARDVVVAPQRVNLREPRALPRRRAILATVLVALACAVVPAIADVALAILVLIVVLVLLTFVAAPYVVLVAARWLDRSRDPMRQLAAARLRADLRSPGRIVAVVAVCGATFLFGVVSLQALYVDPRSDAGFYRAGAVLALVAAGVALAVSVLSLLVAASEQILDAHRATAVLTAFGVSTSDLRRALRHQLTSVTVLASGGGALVAQLAVTLPFGLLPSLGAPVGIAIAVVPGLVAAWIAAAFLSPQIAHATSAENLRTA